MKIETAEYEQAFKTIERNQTDDKIRAIYGALKDEPKVRWKHSIMEVVGLPELPESAGGVMDQGI